MMRFGFSAKNEVSSVKALVRTDLRPFLDCPINSILCGIGICLEYELAANICLQYLCTGGETWIQQNDPKDFCDGHTQRLGSWLRYRCTVFMGVPYNL